MILVVKHNFTSTDESELTVKSGDIVRELPFESDDNDVNNIATNGWTLVETTTEPKGNGFVPTKFLEEISESDIKERLQMNEEEHHSQFENKCSSQGIYTEANPSSYPSTKSIKDTFNNNSEIDYHGETLASFTEYNMDTSQLLGSVDPLAATLDPLKFQEHSQPPQPPYGLRFQGFIKPNLDAKQSSSYAYHKILSNTKQMDRIPSLSQTVKQEEHNELSRRHREYYNRMVENYAESSDILNNVCEQLDGKIVRSAADLEKYCRKVKQLDEMLDQERKKWKQQYEIEAVRSLNPNVRTTRQNKAIVGSPSRTAVNV